MTPGTAVRTRSDVTSTGSRIEPREVSPLSVTIFHGTVVLYYMVMNVLMGLVSLRLYEAGHPITKMFLGGFTHFFTTWNQVFQQSYFVLSLVEDILGYSTSKDHIHTRLAIEAFKKRLFGPILMPATCLTVLNFWGIFHIVPHLMLDDLVAFYPAFLNHVMHTFIAPLVYVEMVLIPKQIVPFSIGFRDTTYLMVAYSSWVYTLGLLTNQWPYPFLEVMNFYQHLIFVPCMFLHGFFWYIVNDRLLRLRWGAGQELKRN